MMQALAKRRESEAQTFFRILFHDDRNSCYIVSTDDGGTWHDEAFTAEALINRKVYSDANWYVTHNGFTGCRRKAERTRQLNAILFDIDFHDAPLEKLPDLIDLLVARVDAAVKDQRLPEPNIIVDSGRGAHFVYVLNRSVPYRFRGGGEINVKGERLFRAVQEQIADVLDEVITGIEWAKLDRSVFDHARVSRIPGTWNAAAWRFARLLRVSDKYHHLDDLRAYKPARVKTKKRRQGCRMLVYNPLMAARLRKVEELQEYRGFNCEGSRELMTFVYYNTAVQIYPRGEAARLLAAFNERFVSPLPRGEIDNIVFAVDKNINYHGERGFYLLGAKKVAEMLSLTEEEMDAINFFSSKRTMERLESKRKTKERRDRRNEEIVRLYSLGSMTQKGISEAVGCSLSTVKTVLESRGLTRRRDASRAHSEPGAMTLRDAAAFAPALPSSAGKERSKNWQPCHVVTPTRCLKCSCWRAERAFFGFSHAKQSSFARPSSGPGQFMSFMGDTVRLRIWEHAIQLLCRVVFSTGSRARGDFCNQTVLGRVFHSPLVLEARDM